MLFFVCLGLLQVGGMLIEETFPAEDDCVGIIMSVYLSMFVYQVISSKILMDNINFAI